MTDSVPTIVYVLCGLTALTCTFLLIRSFRHSRQKLLLLIGLCFAGLTVNNILLPVDLIWLKHEVDLSVLRSGVGFLSVALLLVVLIWEAR
jgi:hypothetical protein